MEFYKYSALLFFLSILFLPINSDLWMPLGFVGMISGVLWLKNVI
ncbi:MAG: hypothetical protein ABFQ65_01145 [Nanoarchaeota archaeon]